MVSSTIYLDLCSETFINLSSPFTSDKVSLLFRMNPSRHELIEKRGEGIGDFVKYSWTSSDTTKIKEAYSRGLEELRTKLAALPIMQDYDVQRLPILLATDSTDLVLLEELNQLRWKLIDHGKLETEKKYGGWYPGLLDSAILSRAVGLVG